METKQEQPVQLFTAEQFCGIKSIEKRMWYVVDQLFPKETHTIEEWIELVSRHGIFVIN